MSGYQRQTHRSFNNHTHLHQQQQRAYTPCNFPRLPNYQSSRRHHNVHDSPFLDYLSFDEHENFAQQFEDQYQTPIFQPPLSYLSSDNHSTYGIISSYHLLYHDEQIDDVYVSPDQIELTETSGSILDNTNYMTDQQRNLTFLYPVPFYRLPGMYDHDNEEKEDDDDDDVLKYLKIRTHYGPAKDGVDPEVVADVELESCAICQSKYEQEESIGALQCGHEYHAVCIKQWLLTKKDCPMCRASIMPSQK